ncbi:hypothetical protein HK104_008472 [Borealophlyctis nickersoniae]|nr:hypothetical protein HK104_008472 [Borealophlyctis nickersoniae]
MVPDPYAFTHLLSRGRKRNPTKPWQTLPQPVPLVKVLSERQPGTNSIRYIATGITPEAEMILNQLPVPIHIIAFTGYGRSGKSFTATKLREEITGNAEHKFVSAPGNVPCTHGIDMMVMENPRGRGAIVFLDCEGGGNNNQSALPFVIGLAARLSTKMYVFERGCFTTAGLDTVMQVINMGYATSSDEVDITRSLVLVENMSINQDIPDRVLLEDLLSQEDGDEQTNRVRRLIRERFDVAFCKLPYNVRGNTTLHHEACQALSENLLENLTPFVIGGVPVDGGVVVQLVSELLAQIRGGGNRFNMVTATEALVSNMAAEAANTVWIDFVGKVRKQGNHPVQINGRKHLRTVLREIEGAANSSINELESFTARLVPQEPAGIARATWDRNYRVFEADVRAAHQRKFDELKRYNAWGDTVNRVINEVIAYVVEAIRHLIRFARFSTTMVMMSNYWFWKHSINLVTGVAHGVLTGA